MKHRAAARVLRTGENRGDNHETHLPESWTQGHADVITNCRLHTAAFQNRTTVTRMHCEMELRCAFTQLKHRPRPKSCNASVVCPAATPDGSCSHATLKLHPGNRDAQLLGITRLAGHSAARNAKQTLVAVGIASSQLVLQHVETGIRDGIAPRARNTRHATRGAQIAPALMQPYQN